MVLRIEAGDPAAGEGARAHRLAGLQIGLHDAAEDVARPFVELA
jgi:hypothetical protein